MMVAAPDAFKEQTSRSWWSSCKTKVVVQLMRGDHDDLLEKTSTKSSEAL
jgi:hypothetical protein